MNHDKRFLATVLAAAMILTGLGQLVPPASATHGCGIHEDEDDNQFPSDIEASDDAWVRSSNPASEEAQASRLMNLFLYQQETPPSDVEESTNGIDGYVHDLGCETQAKHDWCLHSIRDDQRGGLTPLGKSEQIFEGRPGDPGSDRTDDWHLAFYSEGPNPTLLDTAEVSNTQENDLCDPSETFDAEDSTFLPAKTRYVVIQLDSSDLLEGETDLDTVENLLPRGYQTRELLYGTYNAQIAMNICFDQQKFDTDPCE